MNLKKIIPYIVAIFTFIIASLLYFNPVLSGEQIKQGDIRQFSGMAKEIVDYRQTHNNEEPYWLGNAFSGMPAYQVSAYFPNDYISYIDKALRFLPRPADYVFLYFFSFFVLLMTLKTDWKLAILGALSFGFSTYLIIIFGAGHNAKAHAIAYMPLVISGFLLVFQKRYLLGFVVTSLAMALEVFSNHPQMTYYLGFSLLILTIIEAIEAFKTKKIKTFALQSATLLLAVVIGIGVNATRLASMKEYATYSTRGNSELTFNPDGSPKKQQSGLDYNYITEYSYGKLETFNLLIPRFMGGGSREKYDENTNFYKELSAITPNANEIASNAPSYWGQQPIVEAPAYIGAIVVFLFLLGIFILEGKLKIWLVSTVIFSILLSWGKNFSFLTDFFIDYIPLYNKFRAVSSIQVLAELCAPLLGILALKSFFSDDISYEKKKESLKKATISFVSLVVFGFGFAYIFGDFQGVADANIQQFPNLLSAIKSDRQHLLLMDSLRSLVFVALVVGILYAFIKGKLKSIYVISLLGVFILIDLVSIDYKYVNKDDFTDPINVEQPFQKSEIDKQILEDKSYYRVANIDRRILQGRQYFEQGFTIMSALTEARTAYFHNSIGGYHAAKMKRYQELFEYNYNVNVQNPEILNMLNVKYFVSQPMPQFNSDANGAVWFVDDVYVAKTADEEMKTLLEIDTKETAIVRQRDKKLNFEILEDSTATIDLKSYQPNHLIYESNTKQKQFAVFSEIYYKDGWNAYIDDELKPYYQTNYVLRGMEIPAGKHKVEFKFEPKVIRVGSKISMIFYMLLILIPVLLLLLKIFLRKKNFSQEKDVT